MLTKSEIIKLSYTDESKIGDPDMEWCATAENLGLNPTDYIFDFTSNSVRNIYELYCELIISEREVLKRSLATLKSKRYGSNKHDFMPSPKEYMFYGEPQNRDEVYYLKKLLKTEWANANAFEFARVFAQGDSIQPLNTEELIHSYCHNKHIDAIDEKMLSNLNEADITISEWERAMVLKDFLYLQKQLSVEVENHSEIFITEVMPKKFMYGQTVIYNPNKKAYSVDGAWIPHDEI